jgi:putative DNA primase/helicase
VTLASFEDRARRGDFVSPHIADLAMGDTAFEIDKALIRNSEGSPKALLANVITMLRFHRDWRDCLAYNEFSKDVTTKKAAPWHSSASQNWSDYDDSRTAEWMQHNNIFVTSKVVAEAVQTVAKENSFHPVREYLRALKWDNKPRIDRWLSIYLGSEETTWTKAVGPRWLISAIARIERPGCQVDHTLLLEGAQGIRKSTALRILAGDEWFVDHISDLGSKDSRLELRGKWIFEISELDRVRRGEIERVKAFLTARTDHFRLPYSRRAEDVPRSCIFAATVNDQTPLTDETGNRRFWPIKCGAINIEALTCDRGQIWAEAYQRYISDSPWWLDSAALNNEARREQEQRYDSGVWDNEILSWCDAPTVGRKADMSCVLDSTKRRVTLTEILIHAVGKDLDRCTQQDRNQVARCLIHDGWTRARDWSRGPNRGKWFYVKGEQCE